MLAVENLEEWLKLHPDMRHLVRTLDDLTTKVEGCWVDRHTGTDELAKKALRDEMAAMKGELLGSTPSILEKILGSAVLIAHLSYQRAAHTASFAADNLGVQAARERQMTAAQKRLVAALKAWEQIAGKKAAGIRPPGKLALFVPDIAVA